MEGTSGPRDPSQVSRGRLPRTLCHPAHQSEKPLTRSAACGPLSSNRRARRSLKNAHCRNDLWSQALRSRKAQTAGPACQFHRLACRLYRHGQASYLIIAAQKTKHTTFATTPSPQARWAEAWGDIKLVRRLARLSPEGLHLWVQRCLERNAAGEPLGELPWRALVDVRLARRGTPDKVYNPTTTDRK